MKSILLPILLLLTFSTFAQNHLIGIKGGVSWTDVSAKDSEIDSYFRTSYFAGLSYEYQFAKNFLVGADILYLQRGVFVDAFSLDESGRVIRTSIAGKNESKYEYIALPIKGGYKIGNKITGFANIGIVPCYLLKATAIWAEQITQFTDETFDFSESVPDFDIAALVEIGGNAQITEKLYINASFSFQHSLTATVKSEYRMGDKGRHYGMMLAAGIKYVL